MFPCIPSNYSILALSPDECATRVLPDRSWTATLSHGHSVLTLVAVLRTLSAIDDWPDRAVLLE